MNAARFTWFKEAESYFGDQYISDVFFRTIRTSLLFIVHLIPVEQSSFTTNIC